MKTNTCFWIALIALSALSFSISGTGVRSTTAALILAAAGLKSAAVGWQFMELRSAHPVWRVGLFALLTVGLSVIFLLFPR